MIGQIFSVKPGSEGYCGNFLREGGKNRGIRVKLTNVDGALIYDIIASNGEKLNDCSFCFKESDLIQDSNKKLETKISMALSEKVIEQLSVGDQKLYKAGLLNDNLDLTIVGHAALDNILKEKFENNLIAVAEKVLAEQEEKEKAAKK